MILECLLLCASLTPKPVLKVPHFDTGWWARAHWTAAGLDYASTGLATAECYPRNLCYERDPLARPFIGNHGGPLRLSVAFLAESAAVSLIPDWKIKRVKVRRLVQIGLIASHLGCGIGNLKRWH